MTRTGDRTGACRALCSGLCLMLRLGGRKALGSAGGDRAGKAVGAKTWRPIIQELHSHWALSGFYMREGCDCRS